MLTHTLKQVQDMAAEKYPYPKKEYSSLSSQAIERELIDFRKSCWVLGFFDRELMQQQHEGITPLNVKN